MGDFCDVSCSICTLVGGNYFHVLQLLEGSRPRNLSDFD